jgi:hypothetical protein
MTAEMHNSPLECSATKIENIPLVDHLDNEILMHRDTHFGGQFLIMLEYYEKEGKGSRPEFDHQRILALAKIEQKCGQNLSEILLQEPSRQLVKKAQLAYQQLKEVYTISSPNSHLKLITDLILSEEEDPREEIAEITKQGPAIIDDLLLVFNNEDYYNPLFPGYGFTPELVARCLGLLKSSKAIQPLFEKIARVDFFIEDALLEALCTIGIPSKNFLLNALQQLPFNDDNEKAAVALIHFRDHNDVASKVLNLLILNVFHEHPNIIGHLIIICESLVCPIKRKQFATLQNCSNFPEMLKQDIKEITQRW